MLKRLQSRRRCYEEGYITLEELAKCLKDEANIEVDCW